MSFVMLGIADIFNSNREELGFRKENVDVVRKQEVKWGRVARALIKYSQPPISRIDT